MKFVLILLLAIGLHGNLLADFINVNMKLNAAKVYLSGCELRQSGKTRLKKGKNIIILENISEGMEENSIRINAEDGIILSILKKDREKVKYGDDNKCQEIQNYIDKIENHKEVFHCESAALNEEMELMKANKKIGGNEKLTVQQLKEMADFFRTRVKEIRKKLLELKRKEKELDKEKIKLYEKYKERVEELDTLSKTIIELEIYSERDTKENIQLVYYDGRAGWAPEYNLYVENINSDMEILYKAMVRQETELDWNDIDLILSTGQPSLSIYKPQLNTLFANLSATHKGIQEIVYTRAGVSSSGNGFNIRGSRIADTQIHVDDLDGGTPFYSGFAALGAKYIETSSKYFSFEYKPKMKYTIPSDGKFHTVSIKTEKAQADYEYYAAPVLAQEAYLMAKIPEGQGLKLLSGSANIYFEKTFSGRTYINTKVADSVLNVSLAVDKGVIVKRKSISKYRSDNFLSSNEEVFDGYEIAIRNTKSQAIK